MIVAGFVASAVLAAVLLLLPWWWPGYARRGLARRRANVATYRLRLAELRAEARAGTVDAAQLPALEDELGRRLLADATGATDATDAEERAPAARSRAVPVLATLALLAFAGSWYALAGSWRVGRLVELSRENPEAARAESLAQSANELTRRVAEHPDDGEAWAWLGRVRLGQEDFTGAAAAFAQASSLAGEQDPDLLAAQGEALAYTQDRRLAGEPARLFGRALALAPDHPQALWYAGLAALQAGDAGAAKAHWSRLLKLPIADDMRTLLERALAGLGEAPQLAAAATVPVQLTVEVSLAPELAQAVQGGETLFVYALEPGGPPMPVAARRLAGATLPLQVVLGDGDSVMPGRALSGLDRWTVRARLSRSGDARAAPGDLIGEQLVSRAEAKAPVTLRIDRRVGGEME